MDGKAVVLMTYKLPAEWQGDTLNDCEVILAEGNQKGISPKLRERLELSLIHI